MPRLGLVILGLAAVPGCDPPCESYWKLACDRCDDSGCRLAKERAETSLADRKACNVSTDALKDLFEEPGGKNAACSLPIKGGLPTKKLFGAWRCGTSSVTLGADRLRVNDSSFEVVQLTDDFLNVKLADSEQTTCRLHLEGDALALACATPLGSLGKTTACARTR